MKWDGPDSVNSWLIALACCFINTMMFGMARLSGVLFVASIPRYNVGRKQASFPYTFASFLRNISGPLVGYLGNKFGVRSVTSFGALIGAIGAGFCFLAESIDVVTLLWGAVFGLGYGLGNILLPISINQYFDKHRATASGISFSGACLGSFILPPIVEILLNKYGLSQTFLFLSGFILNCVPAALLLRKPCFKNQKKTLSTAELGEKQNISSITKQPLSTLQNTYNEPAVIQKQNSIISDSTINKINSIENITDLSYEERMKRLSTHTLLSGYSVHMSSSEPLHIDQIMEKNNGIVEMDLKILQRESSSISSVNTKLNGDSLKDEVFLEANSPLSDQCEQNNSVENNSVFNEKKHGESEVLTSEIYENCSLHNDYFKADSHNKFPNFSYDSNCPKDSMPERLSQNYSNFIYFNQSFSDDEKFSQERSNNVYQNTLKLFKESDNSNEKSEIEINEKPQYSVIKNFSYLGSFSVIFDPMFILIAITNGIYTSSFVCMVTIIVDFSRDLHIETSNDKYILMLFSVGDLVGRLGLGWITDHGYMKTATFAAVCFASQALFTAAIALSNGLVSLATFVTLYSLPQAGLIFIFPVIIAQFIEREKQTVAIASSHFFSGPLCLAVSPLIGYFRDHIGAYDWIFYGLALLSAACSICWLFVPCIEKCRKKCSVSK